jgi:hypothetical protein
MPLERSCEFPGCELPALWRPVLMLPPKPPLEWSGNEAQIHLDAAVCHLHKELPEAKDFIDDEGWEAIQKLFRDAGLAEADRGLAWLRWVPYYATQLEKNNGR